MINLVIAIPIENKFSSIPSLHDLDLAVREYVYFVESDSPSKLIKIGKTESLRSRLLGLQAHSPVQLSLVGVINAPAGTERLFHMVFEEYRQHGEWFLPGPKLLLMLKSLPKLGCFQHDEIRVLVNRYGVGHETITKVFRGTVKSKRHDRLKHRHGIFRYGQVGKRPNVDGKPKLELIP